MRLSKNLIPIIAKEQFDEIATEFLKQFYPEALYEPMKIPIEKIASDEMNLLVKHVRISEDLSIYGQIFFSDGKTEIYEPDTDEFISIMVKKGTVFIDKNVFFKRNIGCARNTLAHECFHWFKHKPYFTIQGLSGNEKVLAFRCPTEPKAEEQKRLWSEEDWLEWQANGIAPKILMPKEMFKLKARENNYLKKLNSRNCENYQIYFELTVKELADFFNVSKQSSAIRLRELDLLCE